MLHILLLTFPWEKSQLDADGLSNGKSFGPYKSTYAQCQSPVKKKKKNNLIIFKIK